MGRLLYFSHQFAFDDRTLVHLQIVIGRRLHRGEPFFLMWRDPEGVRHSVWISHTSPPAFLFGKAPAGPINREWLQQLNQEHPAGMGLLITAEPEGATVS